MEKFAFKDIEWQDTLAEATTKHKDPKCGLAVNLVFDNYPIDQFSEKCRFFLEVMDGLWGIGASNLVYFEGYARRRGTNFSLYFWIRRCGGLFAIHIKELVTALKEMFPRNISERYSVPTFKQALKNTPPQPADEQVVERFFVMRVSVNLARENNRLLEIENMFAAISRAKKEKKERQQRENPTGHQSRSRGRPKKNSLPPQQQQAPSFPFQRQQPQQNVSPAPSNRTAARQRVPSPTANTSNTGHQPPNNNFNSINSNNALNIYDFNNNFSKF